MKEVLDENEKNLRKFKNTNKELKRKYKLLEKDIFNSKNNMKIVNNN